MNEWINQSIINQSMKHLLPSATGTNKMSWQTQRCSTISVLAVINWWSTGRSIIKPFTQTHVDTKLTWENYVKNLQTQGKTKCPEEVGKKQPGQLKIHDEFYTYSTYKTHPIIWLHGTDNQNISCPQQTVIQNQALETRNRGSQINGTCMYAKCSLPYNNCLFSWHYNPLWLHFSQPSSRL